LNTAETVVARQLIPQLQGGGYLLADGRGSDNPFNSALLQQQVTARPKKASFPRQRGDDVSMFSPLTREACETTVADPHLTTNNG
jgi:hypothetical protein